MMRTIRSYIIFGGLACALTSCASPYYMAQPAPVYYPLQRPDFYYPAQRAGIYYPRPPASLYSESAPAPPPVGEQNQPGQRIDRRQGTDNDSTWIDPEP
jgi:hypothetical protein